VKRLISICGASASGKTTLSFSIINWLNANHNGCAGVLVPLDSYYKDLSHLPMNDRIEANFDHPDLIDFELIEHHLSELLDGRAISMPNYCFKTHSRLSTTTEILHADIVILEGIHVFHSQAIRELSSFNAYIDLDDEVCLARRILRDTTERGRTEECVKSQFYDTVLPMADKFIKPSSVHADILIRGAKPQEKMLDRVVSDEMFLDLVQTVSKANV